MTSADEALRGSSAFAALLLTETMRNPETPLKTRLELASEILDRTLGRPAAAAVLGGSAPVVQIVDNIPETVYTCTMPCV